MSSGAPRSVVLGTAGHIDHGKTALVLALTGIDADRLPEEKARGITIDLGFASMDLTGAQGKQFDVSLIDVPGHHAFVRNMLAGAGGIDAVLLVVAADEGVKAQTREHLQICRLLGIQHGLVVLTKRDAVTPERIDEARNQVGQLVDKSFLQGAPVLAVSALTGQGIDDLKRALADLLYRIPPRSQGHVARLPVDRVFSVRGFGTVVTGTLQAGTLRTGESLSLEPEHRKVRVRGLQVHGNARTEAGAPNRVALNLAGVDVAEVRRGDTLVPENTLQPVTVLDAEVELLPSAFALRARQRVRVHAFTSESLATVLLYPAEEPTSAGGTQLVRLRLSKPMLLVPGDRFVLRHPSPAATLGGGRVLDAYPRERLKKALTARWLKSLRGATISDEILLRIQRQDLRGMTLGQLVAETGWHRGALGPLLEPMLAAGSLLADEAKEAFLATEALAAVEQRFLQELLRSKEEGIARAELRSRLGVGEWVFSRAAARLTNAGKSVVHGDRFQLPAQRNAQGASHSGKQRADVVEQLYRAAGLTAPLVTEAGERLRIAPTEMRALITLLLRDGKLVRLGSDALLMHRDALAQLVAQLQQHRGERFDVGRFKEFTALTRKHAIPLLEYLDGARITRNTGGVRVVL